MTEAAAEAINTDEPHEFWRETSSVPTRASSFSLEEPQSPVIMKKRDLKRHAHRERQIDKALLSAKRFLDRINDEDKENVDP